MPEVLRQVFEEAGITMKDLNRGDSSQKYLSLLRQLNIGTYFGREPKTEEVEDDYYKS